MDSFKSWNDKTETAVHQVYSVNMLLCVERICCLASN